MAECKKNRINYTTAKHSGTTCYTSSLFGTRILWLIASYDDVPPSLELRSTANGHKCWICNRLLSRINKVLYLIYE